jgi:hypothetical protein
LRAVGSRLGLIGARSITLLALLGSALPGSMAARAQTSEPTIEQLQKEVRQRDAIIQSLVRRVEKLERQVGTGASAAAGPTRSVARSQAGAAPTVATVGPAEAAPAAAGPKTAPASAAGATQQAADTNPPANNPPATSPPANNPPAPGQFEVNPEAAERALERTLVATGNLLVPKGFAEIEPLFSYTRRENPTQVIFDLNRNELSWALDMRFGLPWESQFEIVLPYNLAQQQVTDIAVAPPQQVSNKWGNSFGDLTVGLSKTFVHESGWIPDLLGRVNYEIPTGPENSNQVPLTSRRSLLAFSLTAVKRQDPLVFVATGGYTKSYQAGQINLGDQVNFLTGVFLASSPETSLRAVLQNNFVQDVRLNDITFRGSDTVQSILTFGASSILGRGILVDLQAGIGLTTAAPKYTVILSGTYRFGMPGL